MRLIDADAFIEYLVLDAENAREENLGEIVTLEDFDRQPTAYDVDKVVEQLESRKSYLLKEFVFSDKAQSVKEVSLARIDEIGGSIEIIKAGGVNE